MKKTNGKIESVRRLIAIVAVVVTVIYLYWRYVYTFNPNAMFFSWSLFGAELFGFVTTLLFYFSVWKLPKREAPPPIPGRTVDVFIPTKDEKVSILRKTLLACNDLKYPHRTLVLDDGSRPEVKALCEELNCLYLARGNNEHAKAGNINFGLQHSTSEFVAVFDADHVPLPHFIDRLIGYFADEKVGVVQAPQEFYNVDSFQHRVDPKHKTIWGEQYLFFSLIQPGRDRWNAAYFVGSCAMLRRKALDEVGGIATGSLIEDMLTSIRLHAKGWSSVYHNENLAYGIAAETLKPFHIQRQRWGVGSWQVFFKANPLFIRGLTLPQRLCYLSSIIYPLEGFQKLIFYLTPPIALITGVLPMRALDVDYLMHFIPYFAVSTFAFNEMARGFGGQVMLEQFSMGKFFTYMKTIVVSLIPRKGKVFKVTPKGESDTSYTPVTLIIPQFIVLFFSLGSMVWALVELLLGYRGDSFVVAVNCFWALFNSGLALAIVQYDYKKLFQRRGKFRVPDTVPVLIQVAPDEKAPQHLAVADNFTEEGLSLFIIGQIPIEKELQLHLILPGKTYRVRGQVMQQRSVTADHHTLSHVGVKFSGVDQGTKDEFSRYIHESAISKFMKEYFTHYKTYLEKRFMDKQRFHERAYRALAYLPVISRAEAGKHTYGVMKDVSETGLLLASRVRLAPGSPVTMDVILDRQRLPLEGTVVRDFFLESEEFPEYLVGVQFDKASREKVPHLLGIADKVGAFLHG